MRYLDIRFPFQYTLALGEYEEGLFFEPMGFRREF